MQRTLGAFGAVVLAASAIGLAGSDVRAGSGHQPAAAAPEGDIAVWAMGTEGENLGALADAVHGGVPRRQRRRDRDPVGLRPRSDRHRHGRGGATSPT